MRESSWRRGWNDAWIGNDTKWVVFLSVLADLFVGVLAVVLTIAHVTDLSIGETFLFGAGGAATVQLVAFVGLLIFSLQRASVRQRNEAWSDLDQIRAMPAFEIKAIGGISYKVEPGNGFPDSKRAYLHLPQVRLTNRAPHSISLDIKAQLFIKPIGSFVAEPDYGDLLLEEGERFSFPVNMPAHSSTTGTVAFAARFGCAADVKDLALEFDRTRLWVEEHVTGWKGILPLELEGVTIILNPNEYEPRNDS